MPIAAKTVFLFLAIKAVAWAALATQFDPMEEPVGYICVVVFALAALSVKKRRAWWYVLVVETLTLVACCTSVNHQMSQGTSGRPFLIISAVLALVTIVELVLVLRRSTRDWYKSRKAIAT